MPGGRTHDVITLGTAVAADAGYMASAPHPQMQLAMLFTVSFMFAGLACAGDLDINSREYQRWGPFRFIWWPYRQLLPHRSRFSHGLFLGGLLRALYLLTACTLIFWGAVWIWSRLGVHVDPSKATKQELGSFLGLIHTFPHQSLALLAGFVLAGTVHSLADIVSTGLKKMF